MTQIIQSSAGGGVSKESKSRARWNNEEDEILRRAVLQYGGKNWKQIASCFQDRNDIQCLHRWHMVLKVRRRHRWAQAAGKLRLLKTRPRRAQPR